MIFLILLVMIAIGAFVLNVANDEASAAGAVLVIVGALGMTVAWIAWGICHTSVGSEMAAIASLRESVARVDPLAAHNIYGQASEVNQTIASQRRWRHTWFRDFTPAAWDTVRMIDIPQSRPKGTE